MGEKERRRRQQKPSAYSIGDKLYGATGEQNEGAARASRDPAHMRCASRWCQGSIVDDVQMLPSDRPARQPRCRRGELRLSADVKVEVYCAAREIIAPRSWCADCDGSVESDTFYIFGRAGRAPGGPPAPVAHYDGDHTAYSYPPRGRDAGVGSGRDQPRDSRRA